MFLGFWNYVLIGFKWFIKFCKEYGLLILVVMAFVYGTIFLIQLIRGVYRNHEKLINIITKRDSTARTFQTACVKDYDSKQKMEASRSKTTDNMQDENLSDDSLKIDSKADSVEIEDKSTISIESSLKDNKLIE